ncbi:uncharacterized protein J4E79_008607 [Alternaria viburni]|uniref:uncharacterized protein n=1 Tax=Alternaria viburni TaxID=566460 RepID=UPI0020C2CE23|nr:uncharacterized protein J4E79_008607 [Alternaria viburni]KAI4653094.1 hypothetical protein J4E79_008607 [Alternaria viburni]
MPEFLRVDRARFTDPAGLPWAYFSRFVSRLPSRNYHRDTYCYSTAVWMYLKRNHITFENQVVSPFYFQQAQQAFDEAETESQEVSADDRDDKHRKTLVQQVHAAMVLVQKQNADDHTEKELGYRLKNATNLYLQVHENDIRYRSGIRDDDVLKEMLKDIPSVLALRIVDEPAEAVAEWWNDKGQYSELDVIPLTMWSAFAQVHRVVEDRVQRARLLVVGKTHQSATFTAVAQVYQKSELNLKPLFKAGNKADDPISLDD